MHGYILYFSVYFSGIFITFQVSCLVCYGKCKSFHLGRHPVAISILGPNEACTNEITCRAWYGRLHSVTLGQACTRVPVNVKGQAQLFCLQTYAQCKEVKVKEQPQKKLQLKYTLFWMQCSLFWASYKERNQHRTWGYLFVTVFWWLRLMNNMLMSESSDRSLALYHTDPGY